jgi:hypothetical protein
MIYVTGDIHGDVQRFSVANLLRQGIVLTAEDTVIICGDFGLVWYDPPTKEERYGLEWLAAQPCTFVFVDGNHENFDMLKTFPVEKWKGGRVQPIRKNVLHLLRGEIFTIEGHTFFCFGGATSIDKEWRIMGESWWPEENATQGEFEYAERNLASHGWSVDYVVTHTAPEKWKQRWGDSVFWKDVCKTAQMLDSIEDRVTYKKWFFGHLHIDDHADGKKDMWLYEDIIKLL